MTEAWCLAPRLSAPSNYPPVARLFMRIKELSPICKVLLVLGLQPSTTASEQDTPSTCAEETTPPDLLSAIGKLACC
jgi:hypothetical protein